MSESETGTGLAAVPTMTCKACGEEKPEAEFYMQARDGYAPRRMKVCKVCHKKRVRRNTERYRREGRRPD
jgi:hypothetical protein